MPHRCRSCASSMRAARYRARQISERIRPVRQALWLEPASGFCGARWWPGFAEMPNVTFLPGIATASVVTRQTEALATLSDGRPFGALLIVAADGRNSPVRQAAGIDVKTIHDYGQTAACLPFSLRIALKINARYQQNKSFLQTD